MRWFVNKLAWCWELSFVLLILVVACSQPYTSNVLMWETQTVGTEAGFRGLSVVDERVVWVSGTKGTILRTTDGGRTWQPRPIPGTESLDFRDVEAFSAEVAYVLSAGEGPASRIYKTTDGGATWHEQFTNVEAQGFYDALAFWDEQHGLALGDPVHGRFQLLHTNDGGATWRLQPGPEALPNESAFAASGTCLITVGEQGAWFVTGGAAVVRLFHTMDRGQSWRVQELPWLAGNASSGGFSIAFNGARDGVIVGGDYKHPDATNLSNVVTADGGQTWTAPTQQVPFRSGCVWAHDRWLAVGTTGSWHSHDGLMWHGIDNANYNVIASKNGLTWAAGPQGRVAKLVRR